MSGEGILTAHGLIGSSKAKELVSQTFDASGTFTVPAGITELIISAIGGGGTGGMASDGGYGTTVQAAGGGSGHYYPPTKHTVTPGDVLTITVGAMSTAPTTSNGYDGNPTSVTGPGVSITANGGVKANSTNPGAKATGTGVATTRMWYSGEQGVAGVFNSSYNAIMGRGGGPRGGTSPSTRGTGSNGGIGSGGGGGYNAGSSYVLGGRGGPGQVVLEWYA